MFSLNNSAPKPANVSYLSQQIAFDPTLFESRLSMKLLFETTTSSYVQYWLVSDTDNLVSAVNGYFVEVKDRRLQLVKRRQGRDSVVVKTSAGSIMMNPTDISVMGYFNEGRLQLKYKKNSSSSEITWGDIVTDSFSGLAYYAGVVCYYPSGRATSFYFKDWVAQKGEPENPDPEIRLDSVQVISETRLMVHFSDLVNASQARFKVNDDEDGIVNLSGSTKTKKVELNLSSSPGEGTHELVVENMNTQNTGAAAHYSAFFFIGGGTPQLPDSTSVCVTISEIMANPVGVSGLPAVEYVELCNISEQDIQLKDWRFYYGDQRYQLPAYLLRSGEYVVLCGKSAYEQFSSAISKLYVTSFPVLANSGKLLYLEDPSAKLHAVASYSEQWYGAESNKSGNSLEKIDLYNHLSTANNWTASKDPKGGTPGQSNSVEANKPDEVTPQLQSLSYQHPGKLRLLFNKAMDYSLVQDVQNYTIDPKWQIESLRATYPISDQVEILLSDSLAEGEILQLELRNLKCVNSLFMEPGQMYSVMRPRPVQEGDLLVNELLYYPKTDEAEFIELYNNREYPIDLSELFVATRKSDGTLQYVSQLSESTFLLEKEQYVCLSKDIESVRRVYEPDENAILLQPVKLPQFSNTGGTVVLLHFSGQMIDEFQFSPGLHSVSSKNQQGVSLERKSVLVPASDPSNWNSSFHVSGATPGFKNSQQSIDEQPDGRGRIFWSDQKYFRPGSDGYEQMWHLNYELNDMPHKITLQVYRANGGLVRNLVRNLEIGGKGELTWDGKDDSGSVLPIAPYVVYLQYFDQRSQLRKQKWVVTLTK
ncbi:MAG: lamin tail domain-containing protein [Bacteroidales bacterium]